MVSTFNDLIEKLNKNESVDYKELYSTSFSKLIKSIENPQELMKLLKSKTYQLTPLYLGFLFHSQKFEELFSFCDKVDLSGKNRENDFYNSKMIKFYYYSCKALNKLKISEFYVLLAKNKEFNNKFSVEELLKILMEYNVEVKNYRILEGGKSVLYYFLTGHCYLVRAQYKKALQAFDEAEILNRRKSLEKNIKKLSVLCKLLMGEKVQLMGSSEEFRPYRLLISAVENGEPKRIEDLMHEFRQEFNAMDVLMIVHRLKSNALQQGIKRISKCYSRIRVEDISKILGMKIDFLLLKCLKEGKLNCRIENQVLLQNKEEEKEDLNVFSETRKVIEVREEIKRLMEYPKVPVMNYERVMKEQQEFINQYDI